MVINNLILLAKLIIYLFIFYIHMILLLLAIYILTIKKKEEYSYIHYYGLVISIISYKVQRKVIYSSKLQISCQIKVSIYYKNVHLN